MECRFRRQRLAPQQLGGNANNDDNSIYWMQQRRLESVAKITDAANLVLIIRVGVLRCCFCAHLIVCPHYALT